MSDAADTTPPIDYAERRRDLALQRAQARRRSVPFLVLAVLAATLVLLSAYEAIATYRRVHPGVSVAGVDLGGMKPTEARSALQASLAEKVAAPVVVTHGDESWEVSAADLGLSFDEDAMLAEAMGVGRDDGFVQASAARAAAWISGVEVPARAEADPVRVEEALGRIAKTTDVAPVDAGVKIKGVDPSVVPGEDGLALDHDTTLDAILAAMLEEDRTVPATVKVVAKDVTEAEAEAAAAVAKTMLASPVKVTYEKKEWAFEPADIAKWIAFTRSDTDPETSSDSSPTAASRAATDVVLIANVPPKAVRTHIVPVVGAKIGKPAKDARFKTSGGRVTIIPSKDGIGPDVDALSEDLTSALSQTQLDRAVEMKTARAVPKLTTEKAREMGIKERISRYSTTFTPSNRPRVNNIHTLGDALDGELIAPGATFSFNGTVGQRTAAKGYQEAGAIVNGELVPQLGGGICQVNTTLFNTVFESGLPVVQRVNHSFYIDHYPKGRDATVSWGGPDFKFKNDTENWLLLSVAYTNSSITIALYGTDPGNTVEASVGEWRDIKPFSTKEIKDPTMLVGSKVVEDPGVKGRSITVKRTVYRGGERVRTDTFASRYKPKTQVVRLGTKPKPAKAKPDASKPATEPVAP